MPAGAGVAAITVVDDAGQRVTLAAPAQRIISMAPHVTELLFAAGGGERIVGAINFSDYPEAAKKIPLVGSNAQIDMERVIALKPDLLIVWQSGNTGRQLEQLGKLGIPVFHSEPRRLDQVADSLTRFGRLLGTEKVAAASAAAVPRQHRRPRRALRQAAAGAGVLPDLGQADLHPQRQAHHRRRDPPVRRRRTSSPA